MCSVVESWHSAGILTGLPAWWRWLDASSELPRLHCVTRSDSVGWIWLRCLQPRLRPTWWSQINVCTYCCCFRIYERGNLCCFWQRVSIACYAERCLSYDRFCLTDRPSDRPSVTVRYHAKTTPAMIMRSSLEDSPMTRFQHAWLHRKIPKGTWGARAPNERGVGKM